MVCVLFVHLSFISILVKQNTKIGPFFSVLHIHSALEKTNNCDFFHVLYRIRFNQLCIYLCSLVPKPSDRDNWSNTGSLYNPLEGSGDPHSLPVHSLWPNLALNSMENLDVAQLSILSLGYRLCSRRSGKWVLHWPGLHNYWAEHLSPWPPGQCKTHFPLIMD